MRIRHLLFKLRLLTEEAMSEDRRHQAGRCRTRSRIINSNERLFPGTGRGRSRLLNEVHQSVSLKNTLRSLSESVVSHVNFWVVGTQRGPLNCKPHQYKVSFYTKIVLNNALLVNNPVKCDIWLNSFFFSDIFDYVNIYHETWDLKSAGDFPFWFSVMSYLLNRVCTLGCFLLSLWYSSKEGFIMKIGFLGQETDLQNQSDCYVVEDISDRHLGRKNTEAEKLLIRGCIMAGIMVNVLSRIGSNKILADDIWTKICSNRCHVMCPDVTEQSESE